MSVIVRPFDDARRRIENVIKLKRAAVVFFARRGGEKSETL